jgi:hypothetical protein
MTVTWLATASNPATKEAMSRGGAGSLACSVCIQRLFYHTPESARCRDRRGEAGWPGYQKSPLHKQRGSCLARGRSADRDDVSRLQTLGAFLNCEFDLLAFFEILEAIALDSGEVDEHVRAAFVGDKAVAFASVEPFDCAGNSIRHCICLLGKKKKVGFCDTLCSTDSQTKSSRMIREPSFLYNANWWYPTGRIVSPLSR